MTFEIIEGDNLSVLKQLQQTHSKKFTLAYMDPPYNTGKTQVRDILELEEDKAGSRKSGFGGNAYSIVSKSTTSSFKDGFENYEEFLIPRIEAVLPLLSDNGSIFIHLGIDEIHYIKVALDKLIGRKNFISQIVWSFDYGAKSKSRYPNKADYILWYAKDPENYIFNYDEVDRIPYKAPDLVGPEKAAMGKKITNVWEMTIEGTNSSIRKNFNYPTMKPIRLLDRIVRVHSHPGDWVLDPFAGSGTTGEASLRLGRNATALDSNPDAIKIMNQRFSKYSEMDMETTLPGHIPELPTIPNEMSFSMEVSEVTIKGVVYTLGQKLIANASEDIINIDILGKFMVPTTLSLNEKVDCVFERYWDKYMIPDVFLASKAELILKQEFLQLLGLE
jgi:site-specific DNA-methyltransferase (adenine-specific)